ncbi:MAG: hypothetical protein R3E53_11870 [Myxococcota bacterium]
MAEEGFDGAPGEARGARSEAEPEQPALAVHRHREAVLEALADVGDEQERHGRQEESPRPALIGSEDPPGHEPERAGAHVEGEQADADEHVIHRRWQLGEEACGDDGYEAEGTAEEEGRPDRELGQLARVPPERQQA